MDAGKLCIRGAMERNLACPNAGSNVAELDVMILSLIRRLYPGDWREDWHHTRC